MTALAIAALSFCGCLMRAQGGYVTSTRDHAGHSGAAFELGADVLSDDDRGTTYGWGLAIRGKTAAKLEQIALAPEVVGVTLLRGWASPFARAGFHLLQFESADGTISFDMFSPYGEIGVMFGIGAIRDHCSEFFGRASRTFVSLSISAERDVRFSREPDESYVMAFVGVGSKDGAKLCDPGHSD